MFNKKQNKWRKLPWVQQKLSFSLLCYSYCSAVAVTGGVGEDRFLVSHFDDRGFVMKWTGMYLIGYVILIGGLLAALWKMGVLASIGTVWTLIGVVIAIGLGIMLAVASSGSKENIQIDRK